MKRIYTETQGAYRTSEKTLMDYYMMTRAMSQFKKYFPVMLKNALGSKSEEHTLGSYKPVYTYDESGAKVQLMKDGKPVLDWYGEIMEGRWKVLGKVFANYALKTPGLKKGLSKLPGIGATIGAWENNAYDYTKLSNRDRLNMVEAFWTFTGIVAAWAIWAAASADGGDEDDPLMVWFKVAVDNTTQQWNLREMVKNAMYYPLPASFAKTYKTMDALLNYGFSLATMSEVAPAIFGDTETALTSTGELEGAHQLMKSLPGIAPLYTNWIAGQNYGLFEKGETSFSMFGAK
jgi:hypothetical protein